MQRSCAQRLPFPPCMKLSKRNTTRCKGHLFTGIEFGIYHFGVALMKKPLRVVSVIHY